MINNKIQSNKTDHKIISISGKRQVTIPQKFFEALDFRNEAECILQKNSIVIRPIKENFGNEFSEQILADLITQGFSGQALLSEFKKVSKKMIEAMKSLISEADSIAYGEKQAASMDDVFVAEDE